MLRIDPEGMEEWILVDPIMRLYFQANAAMGITLAICYLVYCSKLTDGTWAKLLTPPGKSPLCPGGMLLVIEKDSHRHGWLNSLYPCRASTLCLDGAGRVITPGGALWPSGLLSQLV
jgi:hypothetical protein